MNPDTRALLHKRAVSVWLKADLEVMVRRVSRKDNRPLLSGKDPREVLSRLIEERYPVYAEADIAMETDDRPANAAVEALIGELQRRLEAAA